MLSILFFIVVSFSALLITFKISELFNFYDTPSKTKIHKIKIPNIAGLAMLPLSLSIIFLNDLNQKIIIIFILFMIVIFIGFIDDIKNIKPSIKISLLLIPIILFAKYVETVNSLGNYLSMNLQLGYLSFLFTILCILLLTNSFNYLDGIDGLLATNLIITFLYFIIIDIETFGFVFPFVCFLAVYLLFNFNIVKFFPKQFLGDSGSLGLGFLVSAFLIILTQTGNYIHPSIIIWPVAFVVYEFLTINILRIKLKRNIFKRDLNFIFNILAKNYSLKISLLFCSLIQILFCCVGLIFYFYNFYTLSITIFIIFFIIYCNLRLKFFKIS
tara:strand:- start:254 stop:1237 length:984 start_codon:yes stop_codon:yes gene_type:complete